jgi:hypothetical protein
MWLQHLCVCCFRLLRCTVCCLIAAVTIPNHLVRYTELVSHHCSSDALRLMMPALLPHEDVSKRHSITGIVNTFRSRKQDMEKEAEAKGDCLLPCVCVTVCLHARCVSRGSETCHRQHTMPSLFLLPLDRLCAAQASAVAAKPLSVCLPVLRSYAQRVNDLAHFSVFVGDIGSAVHKVLRLQPLCRVLVPARRRQRLRT